MLNFSSIANHNCSLFNLLQVHIYCLILLRLCPTEKDEEVAVAKLHVISSNNDSNTNHTLSATPSKFKVIRYVPANFNTSPTVVHQHKQRVIKKTFSNDYNAASRHVQLLRWYNPATENQIMGRSSSSCTVSNGHPDQCRIDSL